MYQLTVTLETEHPDDIADALGEIEDMIRNGYTWGQIGDMGTWSLIWADC